MGDLRLTERLKSPELVLKLSSSGRTPGRVCLESYAIRRLTSMSPILHVDELYDMTTLSP